MSRAAFFEREARDSLRRALQLPKGSPSRRSWALQALTETARAIEARALESAHV